MTFKFVVKAKAHRENNNQQSLYSIRYFLGLMFTLM